ncbi:hypothetical protein JYU29_01275 [Tianweitania sp. BSSL-BM11]|uniref:DUF1206 domain-containing protein n=1 Tax=Tianweitania aestuarii TaxID=2814886 RepID=A0ABS5RR99_9HYPH|nr:hypothetical protein [Tianweitania aestuarii]MBS9719315.1 hypothetical protein [Tianweitania aestuarii]
MANDETLSGKKPDVRADLAQTTSQMRDSVNKEVNEARSGLHDARDAAYDKASSLADEAKSIAADKTQAAQKSIAGSLQGFGEALRAAGDQLQDSDQTPAAKLVNSAAGGIDSLASSLKDKPIQDVIGEVRKFGQANPTALIAGSVLAGLALGRFLKSSAPQPSGNPGGSNYRGPDSRGAGYRDGDPRDAGFSGRPSSQTRYAPPASGGSVAGDQTFTGFPEGGQTSPAGTTSAGSTSTSAFGSSGSESPFEVDTKDTTSSTYSSTSGTGDNR